MAETTKLNSLKINLLTNEQYKTAKEAGEIDLNQLYMITDEVDEAISWDDLEDKPFGSIDEQNILIDEQNITGRSESDNCFGIAGLSSYANTDVIVEIDGVKYVANTGDHTTQDYASYGLFFSAGDEQITANFTLVDVGWPSSISVSSEGTHTVKLYTEETTITTIPEIYIPDTIARSEDVTTVTIKTWTAADMV